MRRILSTLALGALFLLAGPVVAGGGEPAKATVSVEAAPGSAFLKLNIRNHRKIGKVAILVRDAKGRVVYSEEGKAMTGELVRLLDKRAMPLGELTVTVTARDFAITQVVR